VAARQECSRVVRTGVLIFLAGIPIRDELVLEVAKLVSDPELVAKLERAVERDVSVLALTLEERMTIVASLGEHPPPGLGDLRTALHQQLEWRRAAGL
jgi:hypothetical protein